jgi:hypothetical protein
MMKTLRSLEWQILDLVLSRFSEFWEIGQHMRGKQISRAAAWILPLLQM